MLNDLLKELAEALEAPDLPEEDSWSNMDIQLALDNAEHMLNTIDQQVTQAGLPSSSKHLDAAIHWLGVAASDLTEDWLDSDRDRFMNLAARLRIVKKQFG